MLAVCALVLAACEIRTDYVMQIADDSSAIVEFEIVYDEEASQLFGPAEAFLQEEIENEVDDDLEGVTLLSAEADSSDPDAQRVTAVFEAEDGAALDRLVDDLFPGSSFTSDDGTTWTLLLQPDEDVAEDFGEELELDLEALGLDFISGEVTVEHAGSQVSMAGGESQGGNVVTWDPFGGDELEVVMDLSGAAPPAEEPDEPAEEPAEEPVDIEEPVEEPAEEPEPEPEPEAEEDDALAIAADDGLSTALLAAIIGGLLLLLLLILFLVLRRRKAGKASDAAAAPATAAVGAEQGGWATSQTAEQPTQQMPPARPPAGPPPSSAPPSSTPPSGPSSTPPDEQPTQPMSPTQPGVPPPSGPGPQDPPSSPPPGQSPSSPPPSGPPQGPPSGSPPGPPQGPPSAPPPSGPPSQAPPPGEQRPDS